MSTVVEVEVVAPGLLTTVQDPYGRPGFERYGVATGGALDPFAAEAANRLVDNPPRAALLELTLAGPELRFGAASAIALCGADLGPTLDGQPLAPGWSAFVRPGAVLTFGDRRAGARAYLAIAGGLCVPPVLGSASTDLRAGFGGLEGRPLRAGDRLQAPPARDLAARAGRFLAAAADLPAPTAPIRVLPGPHLERFAPEALEALCDEPWRITEQADRMGYRLAGPRLRHRQGPDVVSLGLPVGAIQVPGDGQPIVLLADHQPTGGYTVLACVIRADLRRLAQRLPGETVRFTLTTPEAARAALAEQRALLQALPAATEWDALRWAGALGAAPVLGGAGRLTSSRPSCSPRPAAPDDSDTAAC